jgi:hypothetical protein
MDDRIIHWLPLAVPMLAVLLIASAYVIWAVAL